MSWLKTFDNLNKIYANKKYKLNNEIVYLTVSKKTRNIVYSVLNLQT